MSHTPRVSYFYRTDVSSYYYGAGHPMKPQRLRLTNSLVLSYGLYKSMSIYRPHPLQYNEMIEFHTNDYIDFLKRVTVENSKDYLHQLQKFNLGQYTDCFDPTHQLLTSAGFKYFSDLSLTDRIATYNSENDSIEYCHPTAIIEKDGVHDMINFKQQQSGTNSIDCSVTAGHNMYTRIGHLCGGESALGTIYWSPTQQNYSINTAGSLAILDDNSVVKMLAAASNGIHNNLNYLNLPFVNILRLTTSEHVATFIWLYGYWLGDGSLWYKKTGAMCDGYIMFSPVKQMDKDRLRQALSVLPLVEGTAHGTGDWHILTSETTKGEQYFRICNKQWVQYFSSEYASTYLCGRENNTADHSAVSDVSVQTKSAKWVWKWAWELDVVLVRLLIDGLLIADGHKAESGDLEIHTPSEQFRDELVQLLMHGGYAAVFSMIHEEGKNGINNAGKSVSAYTGWRIRFSDSTQCTGPVLMAQTDITTSTFTGTVRCVNVQNHLIFVRRVQCDENGHIVSASLPIITGNCPVFDGLYEFCSLYSGGSIDGAIKLNHNQSDICVNWSGGLHHAKKNEASGFCYINDIVLAILELLKYHARVIYIDIDIHHGDGVEEAFYTTDRVMTVSFHKFGDFFPGTGALDDIGAGRGKYYSVNVPLNDGIDDKSYMSIFKPVIQKVMDVYRPSAVVLQCGADSVSGDRLGRFNLTVKGHGDCVKFVKSFGLPTLVLGGGGYNIRNVARTWCYETSVIVDSPISNNIPYNEYFQYYGPEFKLHLNPLSELQNLNTRDELEKVRNKVLQYISTIEHAPSVQMHTVPPDTYILAELQADADELSQQQADRENKRMSILTNDKLIDARNDYYDGDTDNNAAMTKGIKHDKNVFDQIDPPDTKMNL